MLDMDEITRAVQLIQSADRLIISAGAGMGVDSGLPDFRGVIGFWGAFPALASLGKNFQAMANPTLFKTDPELAWGFYGLRLNSYRAVIPHEGFAILRSWASEKNDDYFVFTSNVDGQFQKSGFDEKRMYECHGSIHFLQCVRACRGEYWSADEFTPVVDEKNCLLLNEKPHCPVCGSLARPNIMMFDDTFWLPWRSEFQSIRMRDWLELDRKTVVIELGAGTAIPTVRAFSERLTRKNQASLIRINTTEAKVGREQDVGIEAGALDALRAIDALLKRTAI